MKYKLRLLNLKCYLSDESDGDEIYILLNGNKVWPENQKYLTVLEETTALNVEIEITKGDMLSFQLWDFDVLSANDLLGSLDINADRHGSYNIDFSKEGKDKSKYALEFEIG